MHSALRLVLLYVITVLCGVLASLFLPARASAQTVATAPSAAAYPRAVSAEPVNWKRAIATRVLQRGDTLREGDFTLADTLISGRIPYGLDTTTPQTGWRVHRAVAAGEWLRAPAVQPEAAVSAGQTVHAVWTDGAVQLSVAAVALNSAPVGGTVRLRIGQTRRLQGVAMAPDSVRIR